MGSQLTGTTPGNGCVKEKVKLVNPTPATELASLPLICKFQFWTPTTGSVKMTLIWVKLLTVLPGAGVMARTWGGVVSAARIKLTKTKKSAARPDGRSLIFMVCRILYTHLQ